VNRQRGHEYADRYKASDARLPQSEAHALVTERIRLEEAYFANAMEEPLRSGLASFIALRQSYLHFCVDEMLEKLGYGSLYGGVKVNPFRDQEPFQVKMLVAPSGNFFESRVAEYPSSKRFHTKVSNSDAACIVAAAATPAISHKSA